MSLIDDVAINKAYGRQGFYSLQLEIGDRCEQGCIYCYMNAMPEELNSLGSDLVLSVLEDCRRMGITSIEWLGGEPLLREDIFDLMAHALDLGLRNNIWTGGLPLGDADVAGRCAELARSGLISVHVSTLDPGLYEVLHPKRTRRDLRVIMEGIRTLLDLGYPPSRMLNSVTFTGLQSADDMIATMERFMHDLGIATSLNVYHTYLRPGQDEGDLRCFIPDPDDVKRVYDAWSDLSGGGPMPMNCVSKQYCSTTLALLADGSVTPCATIRWEDAPNIHRDGDLITIAEDHRDQLTMQYFRDRRNLPHSCMRCPMSMNCFGCRSRAYASGAGIYGKDPRCFR